MTDNKIIYNILEWNHHTAENKKLSNIVIQDIDFVKNSVKWQDFNLEYAVFFGCKFTKEDFMYLMQSGAFLYPKFKNLPYNPYRQSLYTYQELLDGYDFNHDDSVDYKIYQHFIKTKYNTPVNEALAQRIHDHNIDNALRDLLGFDVLGMTKKKAVGFMGGHSTKRGSHDYINAALAAKKVAEANYYIATGGGPGIMEAANLGAYFANQSDDCLMDAIQILSNLEFDAEVDKNKDYLAKNYIQQSEIVLKKYPSKQESLAIPTWFYGHEPSNLFATHIAKYFSNSIREDTLLAISLYGVVYSPGSAGTTQEIFQEAAQNHYGTFGYYSPMIFLSKKRYVEDTSIYSVLHQLAMGKPYKDLLYLTDSPDLVADFIQQHPPIKIHD